MPTIPPSIESEQSLDRPVKVVNRTIANCTTVKRHSHDWGQFIYANKGVLSVVTDTDRYIVPPEQGVWVLPKISHEVTTLTEVELTSFYIRNDADNALPSECCVYEINHFLKTLILEAKSCSNDYQCNDADDLLLSLIQLKLATAPKVQLQLPYPQDKRLLAMLSIIQNNPSNRYDLKRWGEIVGASSRTLSRLFKAETGLTYNAWRQRLNVQLAISKLSNGDAISTIATDLGYESPSAFAYMFRENTGVTPSYYRDKG
ncbi:AraC family transcriptional regulator [Thalassotalea montiporae]